MKQRIAIVGAGPAGLEAALALSDLGHDVSVFERAGAGAGVLSWGHVRLFSPWSLNVSGAGARVAASAGRAWDADACPTGEEYVRAYLEPLAAHIAQVGTLHEQTSVVAMTRDGWLKGEHIGDRTRSARPFRLLLDGPQGEFEAYADAIVDASGTYGRAGGLGPGGTPALGERALGDRIVRTLPDATGGERARYAGRRTLLIGGGFSAATALRDLLTLRESDEATAVEWVLRTDGAPFVLIPDDPLPDRLALSRLANRAAAGELAGVRVHRGHVGALAGLGASIRAEVRHAPPEGGGRGARTELEVDEVLSLTGYRPDTEMFSELQVHLCYGTEGPMKLAAALMAADGGGADCLAQESAGPDVLRSPEPDFYVVGAKSYGRRSNYLLRLGIEQADELRTLVGAA